MAAIDSSKKAAEEISKWSQKDATGYADFGNALAKISKVIGQALYNKYYTN